jgi:hypothetical protein
MKKLFFVFIIIAMAALLSSCDKKAEAIDNPERVFAYLVGDNDPAKVLYLGELKSLSFSLSESQWEVVKDCQEIYISWQKFKGGDQEMIYIDDGFINIKSHSDKIVIP